MLTRLLHSFLFGVLHSKLLCTSLGGSRYPRQGPIHGAQQAYTEQDEAPARSRDASHDPRDQRKFVRQSPEAMQREEVDQITDSLLQQMGTSADAMSPAG